MELSHKINKVEIRNLQISDYTQLSQSFRRVYSDGSDVFWTHQQIEKLIVFGWNRTYPFDFKLDLELDRMDKTAEEEFAGYSHEKITLSHYEKKK